MAVGITTTSSSGNTFVITATFTDEDGVGVTPTALTYTIYDEWDNLITTAKTPGVIASVTTIAIPASARSLASDVDYKAYRKIKWVGTYNSTTLGNNLPLRETGWFVINRD
jgi:hypothetical protein